MYVETVNPVGVNADAVTRTPTQADMDRDHRMLMLASKAGLSSTGGRRRRRSRRYRRKN